MKLTSTLGLLSLGLGLAWASACSPADGGNGPGTGSGSGDGDGTGTGTGDGDGGIDGGAVTGTGLGGDGDSSPDNPATCEIAAQNRTYVGCEFWPTVTYNKVLDEFNFSVVLANGGATDAAVTITGGGLAAPQEEVVPAGQLKAIALPWVPGLKGGIFEQANTSGGRDVYSTKRADAGAYKVVTSVPVTAWQFSPLQYKLPASGVAACPSTIDVSFGQSDCFSVSNDASLLIPSPALTGNYRVLGWSGVFGNFASAPGGIAITATQDGTTVDVQYGPNCDSNPGAGAACTAGGDLSPKLAGEVDTFTLNAGDVMEIMAEHAPFLSSPNADLAGSLVQADKPVQVISFNPLTYVPGEATANGDHIEETVLPAEVLGFDYIVNAPTAPSGAAQGGHVVRLVGSVDGTTLTYEGTPPAGAPATLGAGEYWDSGAHMGAFRVSSDKEHPFAVASYMLGGQLQGSGSCPDFPCSGDPAMSSMVTPEQFRKEYSFLAPTDYDANFADVIIPDGATVTLDGNAIAATEALVPGFGLARVPLDSATGGSHVLAADQPVGLQVMGFGHATSYYYPGGLNLELISEPPPPVIIR